MRMELSTRLTKTMLNRYNRKLPRAENEFGVSGIGMCMERQRLMKVLDLRASYNIKMLLGQILHETVLPQLVKKIYPSPRLWKRNVFERNIRHAFKTENERDVVISAHVDCDLPKYDRIIEFKTTSSDREYKAGDFLTEVYIMQANTYASLAGRSNWELWIFHITGWNITKDTMFSVITGKTEPELFEVVKARYSDIYDAVVEMDSTALVGPEAQWECNRCEVFDECPYFSEKIDRIMEAMPIAKNKIKGIDRPEIARTFKIISKRGRITYDRSKRVWRVNDGRE